MLVLARPLLGAFTQLQPCLASVLMFGSQGHLTREIIRFRVFLRLRLTYYSSGKCRNTFDLVLLKMIRTNCVCKNGAKGAGTA